MLRRVPAVVLVGAVAAVFFLAGARMESWLEQPAAAGTLAAAKHAAKATPKAVAQPAPEPAAPATATAHEPPAPEVETVIDPDRNIEVYTVRNLPPVDGEGQSGQEVDMLDEPAAGEPSAAPAEAPAADTPAN